MTDRYYALTVVLEHNIREDDADNLLLAIHMLRGVLTVTPQVADPQTHASDARAKRELTAQLLDVLKP